MKSKGASKEKGKSKAPPKLRRMVENDTCVGCSSPLGEVHAANAGQFKTKCTGCEWTYTFSLHAERWFRIASVDFVMDDQKWRAFFTGDSTRFVRVEADGTVSGEEHVLPGYVSP